VSAVEAVIKKGLNDWSPNMVSDPIQDSLLKLIAARKKAKKPTKTKASKSPKDDGDEKSNVVNIIDALNKSVATTCNPAKQVDPA
jgi:DNA end-binding protein Ku